METNQKKDCFNCGQVLPQIGYFCGGCLTQFKCKFCESFLEKDYIGCVNCGSPKEIRKSVNETTQQNINTFKLHETLTDRTIEATFSDDVAKDIAGTLRDAAAAGRMKSITQNLPSTSVSNNLEQANVGYLEAEVVEDAIIPTKTEPIHKVLNNEIIDSEAYPTLKAVVIKNLSNSESEWVLVYAFYISNFGKETFSRQDIIDIHNQSNRKNDNFVRDLSSYIKTNVKASYLNPLDNGYAILGKGLIKAKEVIKRTSGAAPKTKNSFKSKKANTDDTSEITLKKRSNGSKSYKRLADINFHPADNISLHDFIKRYNVKSDNDRNLLFTHYLTEMLGVVDVTVDHIYTCYDAANHKIPVDIANSLNNTKARKGWLKSDNAIYSITTKGVNKLKFWDKND